MEFKNIITVRLIFGPAATAHYFSLAMGILYLRHIKLSRSFDGFKCSKDIKWNTDLTPFHHYSFFSSNRAPPKSV